MQNFLIFSVLIGRHSPINMPLMRLIEEWKFSLEKSKHVGAVLMDLSIAFDFLPKNLSRCQARGVWSKSSSTRPSS